MTGRARRPSRRSGRLVQPRPEGMSSRPAPPARQVDGVVAMRNSGRGSDSEAGDPKGRFLIGSPICRTCTQLSGAGGGRRGHRSDAEGLDHAHRRPSRALRATRLQRVREAGRSRGQADGQEDSRSGSGPVKTPRPLRGPGTPLRPSGGSHRSAMLSGTGRQRPRQRASEGSLGYGRGGAAGTSRPERVRQRGSGPRDHEEGGQVESAARPPPGRHQCPPQAGQRPAFENVAARPWGGRECSSESGTSGSRDVLRTSSMTTSVVGGERRPIWLSARSATRGWSVVGMARGPSPCEGDAATRARRPWSSPRATS